MPQRRIDAPSHQTPKSAMRRRWLASLTVGASQTTLKGVGNLLRMAFV